MIIALNFQIWIWEIYTQCIQNRSSLSYLKIHKCNYNSKVLYYISQIHKIKLQYNAKLSDYINLWNGKMSYFQFKHNDSFYYRHKVWNSVVGGGQSITLTLVLDWYLFYNIQEDEKQSQSRQYFNWTENLKQKGILLNILSGVHRTLPTPHLYERYNNNGTFLGSNLMLCFYSCLVSTAPISDCCQCTFFF